MHLDFTGTDYSNPEGLNNLLNSMFSKWEREYGIIEINPELGVRFGEIILAAYQKTGSNVVILIDEYDKALLDSVGNSELQEKFRNTLRGIYGNLKKMDKFIEFAILTGITKFESGPKYKNSEFPRLTSFCRKPFNLSGCLFYEFTIIRGVFAPYLKLK